ncbi:MAG: putative 2-dehydropantoate 2-reductase [Acidimicrobiales bacterium]
MRSYTIVGTGAIGSLYGGRLAAAGHIVRFLGRNDVDTLRTEGLRVTGEATAIRLAQVDVYADPTTVPPSDVIVIALKAVLPNPAIDVLERLAGGAAGVLTLQNGLGIEDDLRTAAGGRPLVGGLCFTAANRVGPGQVELLGGGQITMAGHTGTPSTITADIAGDFGRGGTPVTIEDDLASARWKKVLWNAPFNTLSVLLGATSSELLGDPDGEALVRSVMDELCAAAIAHGNSVPDGYVDALIDLTRGLPPYLTSMGLDAAAGRPLESEVILGRPLRAGQAAGLTMATTYALYRQLTVLQRRVGCSHPTDGRRADPVRPEV